MNASDTETRGWKPFGTRPRRAVLAEIEEYAHAYFEPILSQFPELLGRIALTVRKRGWFAEYKPEYHVVVRREDLYRSSPERIRFITAHELAHFIQYDGGLIPWDASRGPEPVLFIEQQATVIAIARGYATDFLNAFRKECDHVPCDMGFSFSYFRCKCVFKTSCRAMHRAHIKKLATVWKKIAEETLRREPRRYDDALYQRSSALFWDQYKRASRPSDGR